MPTKVKTRRTKDRFLTVSEAAELLSVALQHESNCSFWQIMPNNLRNVLLRRGI